MARSTQALVALGLVMLGGLLGAGIMLLVDGDGTNESAAYVETCANLDRIRAGVVDTPDIIIFYKPTFAESTILRARDRLTSDPRVESLKYLNQDAAYEEFRRLFADKPELLASTTATALPPSLRLDVGPDTDVPSFVRELQDDEGVYEVKTQSNVTIELQGATMASLLWNAPDELRADALAIIDNVSKIDEPDAAKEIGRSVQRIADSCAHR